MKEFFSSIFSWIGNFFVQMFESYTSVFGLGIKSLDLITFVIVVFLVLYLAVKILRAIFGK